MRSAKCPRTIGFDASTYIKPDVARQYFKAGYRFVMRYLNTSEYFRETPDTEYPVSLSAQELHELTDIGFYVGLVQFTSGCRNGAAKGKAMAFNAAGLGVPDGVHLFASAEMWEGVPWPTVKAFLVDWQNNARNHDGHSYRRALYNEPKVDWGDNPSHNIYMLPGYTSYWASAAMVPMVANRGCALNQGTQFDRLMGACVDQDHCRIDYCGGRPYMVVK